MGVIVMPCVSGGWLPVHEGLMIGAMLTAWACA